MRSNLGNNNGINQGATECGQIAFGIIRIFSIKKIGNNKFQNRITQEFQTFIVRDPCVWIFINIRTVNKCLLKQIFIFENYFCLFFKIRKINHGIYVLASPVGLGPRVIISIALVISGMMSLYICRSGISFNLNQRASSSPPVTSSLSGSNLLSAKKY